jgi:hypothetical protein
LFSWLRGEALLGPVLVFDVAQVISYLPIASKGLEPEDSDLVVVVTVVVAVPQAAASSAPKLRRSDEDLGFFGLNAQSSSLLVGAYKTMPR